MYPLAGGAAALEMPAGEFAVPQPSPEIRVLPIELVEAEHAVVLALERLEAVAEETQEVFVGIGISPSGVNSMTAMDCRMASLIALSRSSSEWLRVTSAAIFSTSTTAPSAFFTGK